MDTMYREEILEHYSSPQNFGKLEKFDKTSRQLNPFCGDEIEMFIKFSSESIDDLATQPSRLAAKEISFIGKACAISIAGASILTEYAKNKTKNELTNLSDGDMLGLLGIEVSETRKKCALLALAVLRDCLK